MKRHLWRIMATLLSALMLTSCFIGIGDLSPYDPSSPDAKVDLEGIRVMGTARRKSSGKYVFDSAAVRLDGIDITEQLSPVYSRELVDDVEENVLFAWSDYLYRDAEYSATPNKGYVFDYWRVTPKKDIDVSKMNASEEMTLNGTLRDIQYFLDEIDYTNSGKLRKRYIEDLEEIPLRYLPYITAEYDPEPVYVLLVDAEDSALRDGTKDHPYTSSQFLEKFRSRGDINIILKVSSNSGFTEKFLRFITELSSFPELKDLAITFAEDGITYDDSLSPLMNIENVHVKNLNMKNLNLIGEANWRFTGGVFDSIIVNTESSVLLEGVTYSSLEVKSDKSDIVR